MPFTPNKREIALVKLTPRALAPICAGACLVMHSLHHCQWLWQFELHLHTNKNDSFSTFEWIFVWAKESSERERAEKSSKREWADKSSFNRLENCIRLVLGGICIFHFRCLRRSLFCCCCRSPVLCLCFSACAGLINRRALRNIQQSASISEMDAYSIHILWVVPFFFSPGMRRHLVCTPNAKQTV